jgi:hypothetical protein
MMKMRRVAIHISAKHYNYLKRKAAINHCSVSKLVSEVIELSLREDELDAAIIRKRAKEPVRPYEEFVREMMRARRL